MENLKGLIRKSLNSLLIIIVSTPVFAQYVSPYNSSGNVKSVSERRYDNTKAAEQSKTNARYYRNTQPSTTPTRHYESSSTTSTYRPSSAPVATPAAAYVRAGVADKLGNQVVRANGKEGVIDRNEKMLIPIAFDFIYWMDGGYYYASFNNQITNIYLKK